MAMKRFLGRKQAPSFVSLALAGFRGRARRSEQTWRAAKARRPGKRFTRNLLPLLMLLSILALGAGGCGAYQKSYGGAGSSCLEGAPVAVIPFESLAGDPRAGAILAELFQTELYAQGRLALAPAETTAAKLAPHEGKVVPPDELGQLLGVEYLVVGKVTEYTYKSGLGEEPAVGLSVRLVDARTGRVLWGGARSQTGRYSWIREDSLSRLAQVVCRDLVRAMLESDCAAPPVAAVMTE